MREPYIGGLASNEPKGPIINPNYKARVMIPTGRLSPMTEAERKVEATVERPSRELMAIWEAKLKGVKTGGQDHAMRLAIRAEREAKPKVRDYACGFMVSANCSQAPEDVVQQDRLRYGSY